MSKPINIDELDRGFSVPEQDEKNTGQPVNTGRQEPKKPIWKNCGCLIGGFFIVFFVIPLIWNIARGGSEKEYDDMRAAFFQEDIKSAVLHPAIDQDSISFGLKECISLTLEGLENTDIKYFSKIDEDKILVILKVDGMKKIEASSRKELVYAVEGCLNDFLQLDEYAQYIAVDGRWNLLMTKTPHGSDLGGKFANSDVILPFYGDEVIKKDSLKRTPSE